MTLMFKNKSVDPHRFAMIPKADIPRASFDRQFTHKTTMDAGYLTPIYVDEVLPGDTFNLKMTAFVRMSTPVFPVMDNLKLSTFFFFVPNRLIWSNWEKFMGEQNNPEIRFPIWFRNRFHLLAVMLWVLSRTTWVCLLSVRSWVVILFLMLRFILARIT